MTPGRASRFGCAHGLSGIVDEAGVPGRQVDEGVVVHFQRASIPVLSEDDHLGGVRGLVAGDEDVADHEGVLVLLPPAHEVELVIAGRVDVIVGEDDPGAAGFEVS